MNEEKSNKPPDDGGFVLDDSEIDHGFESVAELHQLVANADISNPEKLAAFNRWQAEDGTKQGLLKLSPRVAS